MNSILTSANIGSTVRWIMINGGAYLAAQGVLTGFDWSAASGIVASAIALGWSYWSNQKKVG
jgi:hypothetical protein